MTITGFIAVAVFDFDIVAKWPFASDKSDRAIGNGPDFCAVRCGVIYTVMSSVFFKNGMKSTAGKWRTDAGKVQRFTQEKSPVGSGLLSRNNCLRHWDQHREMLEKILCHLRIGL